MEKYSVCQNHITCAEFNTEFITHIEILNNSKNKTALEIKEKI